MAHSVLDMDEKLAEAVRSFPVLYNKSIKDFKDRNKKDLAWSDVAKIVGFGSGKQVNLIFFTYKLHSTCWTWFQMCSFNFRFQMTYFYTDKQ